MKFWFQDESGEVREYIDREVIKEETINEVTIKTEELKFTRYVDLGEHGIRNEDIYWEWPFETGDTEEDKIKNNQDDTNWMARESMKMNIIAIGQQILEMPYLANLAKVGDYVNYDANSNGEKKHTNSDDYLGCTVAEDFSTAEKVSWRILSIDKDTKEVTLIAADPIQNKAKTGTKQVTLSGINGYKNVEDELKKIGSIYGHGKGAVKGRSINIDDILQYSNYNPKEQYRISYSSTGTVGGIKEYSYGKFIKGEKYIDENGEEHEVITGGVDIDNEEGMVSASAEKKVKVIQTSYYMDENTINNSFNGKELEYNLLFKNSIDPSQNKPNYWVDFRSVEVGKNSWAFYAHFVLRGSFIRCALYEYDFGDVERSGTYAFVPVVILKPKILAEKKEGETSSWVLK